MKIAIRNFVADTLYFACGAPVPDDVLQANPDLELKGWVRDVPTHLTRGNPHEVTARVRSAVKWTFAPEELEGMGLVELQKTALERDPRAPRFSNREDAVRFMCQDHVAPDADDEAETEDAED